MQIDQVAAQLYTVRDHCKTASNLATTLEKIARIGYRAVQISGIGPIADREVAKMLKDSGLVCCATHESSDKILNAPEQVVDRLAALDCKYTAYPFPPGVTAENPSEVRALAKGLDAAGRVLAQSGMSLSYHNHNIEFRKTGARTMLEALLAWTDAKYVGVELDTYWVQYGGGDVLGWCRRLKGRLPLLHMKDYATSVNNEPEMAEIGRGLLKWRPIVKAAEKSGCVWFIVEQDICPADPFESLRLSFSYINERLCK